MGGIGGKKAAVVAGAASLPPASIARMAVLGLLSFETVKAVAINVLPVPRERRSNSLSPDASELVCQTNLPAG
jgi:hypothetical protein